MIIIKQTTSIPNGNFVFDLFFHVEEHPKMKFTLVRREQNYFRRIFYMNNLSCVYGIHAIFERKEIFQD